MVALVHVVASDQRRGAEVFASDLVRALSEHGLDQHVAFLRRAETEARVPYDAPSTWLGSDPADTSPFDVRALRSLRSLIRDLRPQLVQAHGGETLKYAIPATLGKELPVIYRRIGSVHPRMLHGVRRAAYSTLLRRAKLVVTVAEALRRETAAVFGVPPSQIVTIPNAVDPDRLKPALSRSEARAALGIPLSARVMLSLGAFTWEKDPLGHLDVAFQVLAEVPGTVYLVAGDGPLRPAVQRAVSRHDMPGRVRLLGSRSDVASLLAASDVLLLASSTEGMPGVLIEAGMCGIPAAAYAVGGVPETVEHGRTGYLAPPGDAAALVARAAELLRQDRRRLAMGREARDRFRARYDIRSVALQYLEVYRQLRPALVGEAVG
jgi:glycosyltransferase involved in cell wall biosynthesis